MGPIPTLPGQPRLRDTRTFIASLVLLVVLLLITLVGHSVFQDVEANRALVENDALRYSREAAIGIDAFLSSTNRMLLTLSVSPTIRDRQVEAGTAMLEALLQASPEYANIWATGADGWNWANPLPNPEEKPIYVGDRHYFQEAQRTGRPSIESIPDNRQHPTKFAVVLSVPVLAADGRPNGTVQAAFELLPVQQVLGSLGLPEGSRITVVDEAANVVARYPSPEEWVGRKVDNTRAWLATQGLESGTFDGDFLEGDSRLIGYTTATLAPWKVVVGYPPEAAFAGLWGRLVRQLALLVIPGLVVAGISWRLGAIALDRAERYRTLFNSMGEAFGLFRAIYDEQGNPIDYVILDVNPAGERMRGMERERLVGRTVREAIPGLEGSWVGIFDQVVTTGEAVRYEGGDFDRWLQVYAFRPVKGLVAALFADVTERKRAEVERERLGQELADRASELRAVLDTVPVAVWIAHDPECRTITGNAYADQIMRAPRGSNVSRSAATEEEAVSYRVLRDGVELAPDELPAQVAAATGRPVEEQVLELVFSDGRQIYLLESAVPLLNSEGQVRGAVAAGVDFTMIRKAEAEREQLLAAEQAARVQAEEAVRAREEFLSIAAHELKTPVTSLRGFSQMLARSLKKTGAIDPKQAARALWHVDRQSERLKRLTEQLLDVSRLDSGKLAISPEEVDLASLTANIVDAARHSNPERTLLFREDIVPLAQVDGLRLEQVLSNLLDNAMKFSPKGMPIEVAVVAGGPGWIEVSVRDHGDGVPDGEQERIFERFYQSQGERNTGGMGIGLFISRQIVEMHGGSIRCENTEGGGSRFLVRLPASKSGLEIEAGGGGS